MLPLQGAILRKFQEAVQQPDTRKPARYRIRDSTPSMTQWVRFVNQLNIHAQVAEKAAMISAKRLILDEHVKQKEEELERALIAAGRAPQKKSGPRGLSLIHI